MGFRNKYDSGFNHGYQEGLNKARQHATSASGTVGGKETLLIVLLISYPLVIYMTPEFLRDHNLSPYWVVLAPFWPILLVFAIIIGIIWGILYGVWWLISAIFSNIFAEIYMFLFY